MGVLAGLVIASVLSLILVIKRLSRPAVGVLARDESSGAWGRADRHPGWETVPGVLMARSDGPLFYANAVAVKEQVIALARAADAEVVVIDLSASADLDVETLDALSELADALSAAGMELRLASVPAGARAAVAQRPRRARADHPDARRGGLARITRRGEAPSPGATGRSRGSPRFSAVSGQPSTRRCS